MDARSSKDGGTKAAGASPRPSLKNRGPESLGREYSLKEDLAIKRVYSSGKKFSGGCLKIFYYAAGSLPLQIVIKVPRKNGSAPRRNRIKRIIRETIRKHKAAFEKHGNIIIIADVDPMIKAPAEIIKKDLFNFAGIQ